MSTNIVLDMEHAIFILVILAMLAGIPDCFNCSLELSGGVRAMAASARTVLVGIML